MFLVEVEAGAGDLGRDQGIDDDETPFTLDQGHVRDVEAADLIDAIGHLEEAVAHVEPRLAPEAWIHGGRRLLVGEEGVIVEAPHDASLVVLDLHVGKRAEKTAPRVLEVLSVAEGEDIQHGTVPRLRGGRGVLRNLGGAGHRGETARSARLGQTARDPSPPSGGEGRVRGRR